jgi:hypothetical protein
MIAQFQEVMIARHNRHSAGYDRAFDELVVIRVSDNDLHLPCDLNSLRNTSKVIENSPNVILCEAKGLAQLLGELSHHLCAVDVLDDLASCQEQALVGLATPKQA